MIKKLKLIPLFLFISILGFGQELSKVKTENHQPIAGTNIFMVPPASFQASTNFKGFQNPEDPTAMIMTMEIPGPFLEIAKGFNAEMLKTRGMDLRAKNEIKVNDLAGYWIELDQMANGNFFSKHILVYGNAQATTIINGVYLKDSLALGERIKNSLLTTFVQADLATNPREALNYTLDETVGDLKFKAVMGNGMLLNRDLKTPTESIDKATLLSDKSFAQLDIDDKKAFCQNRIKKYKDSYSLIASKGIKDIEIDGLKGFALFAQNNDNNQEEIYQVILFDENGNYYLFLGSYLPGSQKAISDIQRVIMTFKRKI